MTQLFTLDGIDTFHDSLLQAAELLAQGELVAFPTETVYGLGANALDETAVAKIFVAKGRPQDNPLIVHIAYQSHAHELAQEVPKNAQKAMDAFWPGPFTVVLKKTDLVPKNVSAGLDTVALRMPNHPVALTLIEEAGVPIAAPSANTSGKPSPTSAQHVLDDLQGKIAGVIDDGTCEVGLESTVVDFTVNPPMLLRPGGITKEKLEDVLGEIQVHPAVRAHKTEEADVKSPGMKYTHYSPEAKVILIEGNKEHVKKKVWELSQIEKTAVLHASNSQEFAQSLYADLRRIDKQDYTTIVIEAVSEEDIGLAIMNRVRKAADEIIHCE